MRILEDISRLYLHCYLVTVTVYVFPVYRDVFAHSTSLKQTYNLDSGVVAEPLSGSRVIAPINFTNEPAWGSTGIPVSIVAS